MPLVYSYNSNKGIKKDKNQDAINVVRSKQGYLLSVICDGVSSHELSSYSSNLVVKQISKIWENSYFSSYEDMKNKSIEMLNQMNELVIYKSKQKSKKMGTTIVVTILFENKILVLNVGDSLTYVIDNQNNMELVSSDDSFTGILLSAGVITKEEAKTHDKRHSLTQVLGMPENLEIHTKEKELHNINYVITCSDGLTAMNTEEEIVDIIVNNDISTAVNTLIKSSNKKGGKDNISLALFQIMRGDDL